MHQPVDDSSPLATAFSQRLMQVGPVELAMECQLLASVALHMVNQILSGEAESEPGWAQGLEDDQPQ